jgi:hypothetical protein
MVEKACSHHSGLALILPHWNLVLSAAGHCYVAIPNQTPGTEAKFVVQLEKIARY